MSDDRRANREALLERVLASTLGALDVAMIQLVDRLGYYAVLAAGPATSAERPKRRLRAAEGPPRPAAEYG